MNSGLSDPVCELDGSDPDVVTLLPQIDEFRQNQIAIIAAQ